MTRRPIRRRGADPSLLRQLRGGPVSIVDQPASPMERAFAASATLMMLAVSAWMILA